jgi:hypothetical protein
VQTVDLQADAGQVRDLVTGAMTKQRETLRELIAVPPLVSNELTFEYEHLRRAYSRMLEQMFLNKPGVLVVELAEAQAIGRELAVAGVDRIRRPLPLYLIGSFRHVVTNDPGHLSLALTLRRGDVELDSRTKSELTQPQASDWLRATALELFNAVDPTHVAPPDPRAEARQLIEHAGEFSRTNDWDEALTYYEASLLLEPNDADAHYLALQAIVKLQHRPGTQVLKPAELAQRDKLRQEQFRRGEDHLIAFYRLANPATEKAPAPKYNMASGAPAAFLAVLSFGSPAKAPAPGTYMDFVVREQPKLYARLVEVLLEKGERHIDDGSLPVLLNPLRTVQPGQTVAENFASRANVVMKFAWKSDISRLMFLLAPNEPQLGILPETVAFHETLAKCPQRTVSALAKDWLVSYRAGRNPYTAGPATRPQPRSRDTASTTRPAPNVLFEPITLSEAGGRAFPQPRTPLSWIPLSGGVDLLWYGSNVWLMREPGVLTRVALSSAERINCVCADDATIWVVCAGPHPLIKILDRASNSERHISLDDGLPPFDEAAVCCVGPDRICLVGWLLEPGRKDEGRNWIAWISRGDAAKGRAKVDVFHEARDSESHFGRDAFRETTVSFRPDGCFPLAPPQTPASPTRVLVRRGDNPLLINIADNKVSVLQKPQSRFTTPDLADGTLYWSAHDDPDVAKKGVPDSYSLYALDGAMTAPSRLMYGHFSEKIVLYGGCVHLIIPSDRWYIGKSFDGTLRKLNFEPPKFVNSNFTLFHSNHFGLVASNRVGYTGTGLYAIRFEDVPELVTK